MTITRKRTQRGVASVGSALVAALLFSSTPSGQVVAGASVPATQTPTHINTSSLTGLLLATPAPAPNLPVSITPAPGLLVAPPPQRPLVSAPAPAPVKPSPVIHPVVPPAPVATKTPAPVTTPAPTPGTKPQATIKITPFTATYEYGSLASITVTVTGNAGSPNGSVRLSWADWNGGSTATSCVLVQGTCTEQLDTTNIGSGNVQATYVPDNTYAPVQENVNGTVVGHKYPYPQAATETLSI